MLCFPKIVLPLALSRSLSKRGGWEQFFGTITSRELNSEISISSAIAPQKCYLFAISAYQTFSLYSSVDELPAGRQPNCEAYVFFFSQECSSALAVQTSTASSAKRRILSPPVDQTSPSSSVDQTSPLSSVGQTPSISSANQGSASPSADQTSPFSSVGQTSASSSADQASASPFTDQRSPFSSVGQTPASSSADQASASPFTDQRSPFASVGQASASSSADQASASSSADKTSASTSAEETSTTPSADQTSSSSAEQSSYFSCADQRSLSPSADERPPWQSDQTSTSSSPDQKSPLPFVEQTFPSPSAVQTSLSHDACQRSPSPPFDQASPADQTSASSSSSHTYPSPCANKRFPSSSPDQKSPFSFFDQTSSSYADKTSTSSSANQVYPSSCANQKCPSSFAHQKSLSLSAEQRSPLSADQRSTSLSANQTWFSLFADHTPLPLAAERKSPSLSASQRSTSSSDDQTSFSLFADQTSLPPSAEQRFPSLSADQRSTTSSANQTWFSLFADQTPLPLSAEQRSSSLFADQKSTSLSTNQTSFSLFADQTSCSLSAEQRSPSLFADQKSPSSSTNQTSFSLFADQTSRSLSSEQRSPSLFADQGSASSSTNQTWFSLFADQTSLPLSAEQRSPSLTVDERYTSSSAHQTSFSSFADQRFPSSCADQIRSVEQKKSLSPSSYQTGIFSLFPDQECSSSTFLGQESSILPFGGQSNSLSAVYCQTQPAGIIFESRFNVETSRVSRPTIEKAPRPDVLRPSCTTPSVPSKCYTRPIVPTTADTTFPMLNESPGPSTIRQSPTCASATIRPLMSCDVRPPAFSSHMSISTTPSVPSSNIDFYTMFPTTTGCYIPASIFNPSGAYGSTFCISGSVLTRPLMSCDVRPPNLPSFRGIPTTPPVPSSTVNFDIRFPTPTGYSMSNRAPTTYENTFSVPGSVPTGPRMVCDVRPPAISSLMSTQTTPPVPSCDLKFGGRYPTPPGYSMPNSGSVTYGNTFWVPQSVTARPIMSCDIRPKTIPSLMSIQTTPPVPSSDLNFSSRFPTPSGYSMPSSVSVNYGNTFSVPQSVYTRTLMNCDVRQPAIPSLMSIQTTPPVLSSNFNYGSRYLTPSGYFMPSSGSVTYGNTYCVPQSVTARQGMSYDVRSKTIPGLMSIQTSPPVPSNNIRFLRNTGNRRSVPDSITTTIPSLMSIETRPPWKPIRSQPSRLVYTVSNCGTIIFSAYLLELFFR